MTEPGSAIYRPFPPFAEWAGVKVDEPTFEGYASVLDELRAGPNADALTRAVEFATRAAAIDTGAIEGLYEVDRGFTFTVARGVAAWEKVIAAREPVVRRSFEDALRAYDFVLDLATTRTDVSEKAIREIHELICAGQETYRVVTSAGWQDRPLPKGEYKETPNNPTSRRTGEIHAYTPPIDVSVEMRRLVDELRSDAFVAAHPILQAAWAHYAFVAVHPFADGNGRVARALASVYLYRRPGVPLVIFADQKDAYLDGLEDADQGRPERFVRFIQERVADVIGLVQVSMGAPDRTPAASLASLRETFLTREGMPLDELDRLSESVRGAAQEQIRQRLDELALPTGVQWAFDDLGDPLIPSPPALYRWAARGHPTYLTISGSGVAVSVALDVGVLKSGAGGPAFVLLTSFGHHLPVELRDVFPTIASVQQLKLGLWADNVVARLIADFDAESRRVLRRPD
jgi:fido (protein-threonine AMPylation protein)